MVAILIESAAMGVGGGGGVEMMDAWAVVCCTGCTAGGATAVVVNPFFCQKAALDKNLMGTASVGSKGI